MAYWNYQDRRLQPSINLKKRKKIKISALLEKDNDVANSYKDFGNDHDNQVEYKKVIEYFKRIQK
jgi:hypothetical protein